MSMPHGRPFNERRMTSERPQKILQESTEFKTKPITSASKDDIRNISHGIFSPLEGFLVEEDYSNVLFEKRLTNGTPWTIPIVIDASDEEIKDIKEGEDILLVHEEVTALMHVEDIYSYNKHQLAQQIFGTTNRNHPGVSTVHNMKNHFLGGKIELINDNGEFNPYWLTPLETRRLFQERGWKTVAGFQTRNVPHLGHEYMQEKALTYVDGLFINPLIGKRKPGDFTTRVVIEAYETLIEKYYKERAVMGILETEMRFAGPREALFHAIIRKNFGCTHFIVGRDHAGVNNYYEPYAAHTIFSEFPDLGITPLFFKSVFYCTQCGIITDEMMCPHDKKDHLELSGKNVRQLITKGVTPPKEVLRPEIADIIARKHDMCTVMRG
jgi:sulfate adenylyltransferase